MADEDQITETEETSDDDDFEKAWERAEEAAEKAEQADTSTEEATGDEAVAAEQTAESEALEAPAFWPADMRDGFAKMDAEGQKILLGFEKRMSAAHTKRSQELAQQREQVAPLQQTVAKWGQYTEQVGVPFAVAVDRLMEFENTMRTGSNERKIAAVRQLVEDYGITAPGEDGTEAAPSFVPDPRVDQLMGAFQNMTAQQQQQMQHQQANARAQSERAVQAFATATGPDGKLAHPYFGEVEQQMMPIVFQQIQAGNVDLQAAYDQAVWANPSTRQKMQQSLSAAEAAERQKDVEKAKKAGRAGLPANGTGGSTRPDPSDLDSLLDYNWERLSA